MSQLSAPTQPVPATDRQNWEEIARVAGELSALFEKGDRLAFEDIPVVLSKIGRLEFLCWIMQSELMLRSGANPF